MTLRIAFRVDASHIIGSGHLMRCLVLARLLRQAGCSVVLVSRDLPGNMSDWVETSERLPVARLPRTQVRADARPELDALGCTEEEDATETLKVLQKGPSCDILIVDHYALSKAWESLVFPGVSRTLVIDDLANRPHSADILLDPNAHPDPVTRYEQLVTADCKLLLGPRFAPIRPSFARRSGQRRPHCGGRPNVLVYFGGTDRTGVTLRALEALSKLGFNREKVVPVIGATDPHRDSWLAGAESLGFSPRIGIGQNMAKLMTWADLALGAGGSSQWERCATGLPSLVATLAANQETCSRTLHEAGVLKLMGRAEDLGTEDIRRHVKFLWGHPAAMRAMASRGRALVDGHGGRRITAILLEGMI